LLTFAYASILACWFVGWQFWMFRSWAAGVIFVEHRSGGRLAFSDFAILYNIWCVALSSSRHLLYDPDTQYRFLTQLLGPFPINQLPFAQLTPIFDLLFSPLALLSIDGAFLVWSVCGIITVAIALALSLTVLKESAEGEHPPGSLRRDVALFVLAGLTTHPFLFNELDGQTGAVVAALTGAYVVALLSRRYWLAGVFLGLMLVKPTTLPFLLPMLLVYRRFKVMFGAAVTALVSISAAVVWFGPDTMMHYPTILREVEQNSRNFLGVPTNNMVNVRCMLSYFLPEAVSFDVAVVVMGFAMVALFWLSLKVSNRQDKVLEAQMLSISILAAALFSPHILVHDLAVVAVAGALTWRTFKGAAWQSLGATRFWQALLVIYPLFGIVSFIAINQLSDKRLEVFHWVPNFGLFICAVMIFLEGRKIRA
jgi:Glycosyltransferase family 87